MAGRQLHKRTAAVALIAFACALPLLALGLNQEGAKDRLKGSAAVNAALQNSEVIAALKREPYTKTRVLVLDEHTARVTFYSRSRVVLEAAVAPDGAVTAVQVIRPGYIRAGTASAQVPAVLLLLTLLFMLTFASLPLLSMRNLDLLALGTTSATIWLVNQRLFELSIWLAIPLLAYLAARCLAYGFADRESEEREPRWLVNALVEKIGWQSETTLKWAGVVAALGAVMVCIPGGATGDVGIASLSGATQLLHGNIPYGNITSDVVHGDTYPILAYLLYLPAALVMPVRDVFDNTDGALWISTISLLVTAAALFVAGRENGGRELGLRSALAWLLFPAALITASSGSNDMTTAMFVALAIASIAHAGRSTFGVALAAWAKVAPVLVLPLWIAQYRNEGWRRALVGPVLLTAAMLVVLLAYGGTDAVREMLSGIAFQAGRGSVLSPWTVIDVPAIHLAVQATAVAAAVAGAYAVWMSPRLAGDARRICALAAGILIVLQLGANYWSYSYLPWVYPFIAAALLWPRRAKRSP